MLTHGILAAIPTSYFSSHSLAPFSEHPLRHRVLESPLQAWQPRSIFPWYPYRRSSGISTDGFTPPVHPGYLPLSGMQDPPQQRVQPQNTMPCDLNLDGFAVTCPQDIPGFLSPRGMQGASLHGVQPQITMSDDPYFIGPGVSTHTLSTDNLESLLPHETMRSPQYGFHPKGASPSYPYLQFSGPVTSSVTHSPVIPGNRMRAPLQAPQPQSASPGDPHVSGPVTSSVTQPPVIPAYSYPYGNRMRAPLQAPLPQSASPGDPHFSGPVTSSVTQPPVIPGYSYPYGNRMRAPQQAPLPPSASPGDPHLRGPVTSLVTQPPVIPGYSSYPYGNRMRAPLQAPLLPSASPGDPHLRGPMSSVIRPPVMPGFLSPSGMQRGSSEVQHERNPSTDSNTRPSQ